MIDSFRGEYYFLSNFWPTKVQYQGLVYPSAEHAYQAAKTLDPLLRIVIQECGTAAQAKTVGRSIIVRDNWDTLRLTEMEYILLNKFTDPSLRLLLEKTKPHELIEGNTWHDIFWGCCKCSHHSGIGDNHLGRLLMRVRDDR